MTRQNTCWMIITPLVISTAALGQAGSYEALELPNLQGAAPSFAQDLNEHGAVVGVSQLTATGDTLRPWIWDSETGMVNLYPFGDLSWFASATEINNNGEVLGVYLDQCLEPNPHPDCPVGFIPANGLYRAVLWATDGSGNFTEVPSPASDLGLDHMGVAPGTLGDDGLVGASAALREPGAFSFGYAIGLLWDQSGNPTLLDDVIPGFTIVNISDINDSGQYCGVGSINGTQEARAFFFDPDDGYTVLPRLSEESAGPEQANAVALNNSGQVIGTAVVIMIVDGVVLPVLYGAFVWDPDSSMQNLGVYEVWDINDQGRIVGNTSSTEGPPDAVLYDDGAWHTLQELTDVDPDDWSFLNARTINNSGQIVVNAVAQNADTIFESGEVQPFFLTPVERDVPGDINGDGVTNVSDLLLLLSAWGACDDCPEDLNDDGLVNVADLLVLLGNWR